MIIPVLPSEDIDRDLKWYDQFAGFRHYYADRMYAVLFRDDLVIHLQWHAATDDDPLLGGSVIRIFVNDMDSILEEFIGRGTITRDRYRPETPWGTREFGFYDLNRNAIFVVQNLENG